MVGHRLALDLAELTLLGGMPVPQPAETWAQLAEMVGADALIVAADHLLTRGLATIDELEASISPGRRGAVALRRALLDARAGAESPKETETRLVLVRGGLPEPELNWNLFTDDGGFLARLDLVYRTYKVCVEYDGRQHAEADQFRRDADRWAAIEVEGWIIVRVLSHHLADPLGIVARTRRALESRGWRAG